MKTLLLHTCCAPCAVKCVETLAGEGFDLSLFWYNPNIHPYTEYRSRHQCLLEYAASLGLPVTGDSGYGLRAFLAETAGREDRCRVCYRLRLEKAAQAAAGGGYGAFSTSLLISPYQNHDLLRETGLALAERYGVEFVYRDFRPYFREGRRFARERGFYMQKYCGCIFSEEERYLGTR